MGTLPSEFAPEVVQKIPLIHLIFNHKFKLYKRTEEVGDEEMPRSLASWENVS